MNFCLFVSAMQLEMQYSFDLTSLLRVFLFRSVDFSYGINYYHISRTEAHVSKTLILVAIIEPIIPTYWLLNGYNYSLIQDKCKTTYLNVSCEISFQLRTQNTFFCKHWSFCTIYLCPYSSRYFHMMCGPLTRVTLFKRIIRNDTAR